MKRGTGVLADTLSQRVELLALHYDEAKRAYTWVCRRSCWAAVEADAKKAGFSTAGMGAEGVTVTVRPDAALDLRQALRWGKQFLLPIALVLGDGRDRQRVTAARCECSELIAQPQDRTGRDAMNRPVAVKMDSFTFPGVLTEKYSRNEADEVYRVQVQQRVLVTPKEITLRAGDLVEKDGETPYTVRQVLDLDPNRNEYVIERNWDV